MKKNVQYILQIIDSGVINDYTKIIALNAAGILVTSSIYSSVSEAYITSLNYIEDLKLSKRIKYLQK